MFELYGCFLQGVSGIVRVLAPGYSEGPSPGLRFILDTKPVDMKAACSGLASLYSGVATAPYSLTGGRDPGGSDFEKFNGTRGLSPMFDMAT